MGADFRDIDNDGLPDIVVAALNGESFPLFRNLGHGQFEDVTAASGLRSLTLPMAGFSVGIFDFDNDGWKDIFATCGQVESLVHGGNPVNQFNAVFRNPGKSGKWTAAQLTARPAARHRGSAFADLDGDGRIDMVATALGAPAEIWMNTTANANHWIEFALRGTRSNRDGIGAEIAIVTPAGKQFNHMTTAVGYASSSAGPVHFGLAGQPTVTEVSIRWPSGVVQKLTNVKADQILPVIEPR